MFSNVRTFSFLSSSIAALPTYLRIPYNQPLPIVCTNPSASSIYIHDLQSTKLYKLLRTSVDSLWRSARRSRFVYITVFWTEVSRYLDELQYAPWILVLNVLKPDAHRPDIYPGVVTSSTKESGKTNFSVHTLNMYTDDNNSLHIFKITHFCTNCLQFLACTSPFPTARRKCIQQRALHVMNSCLFWTFCISSHSIDKSIYDSKYHITSRTVLSFQHHVNLNIQEKCIQQQ